MNYQQALLRTGTCIGNARTMHAKQDDEKRKKNTRAVALISLSLANVLPLQGGALHTVLQPAPRLSRRLRAATWTPRVHLQPTAPCGAIIQLAAPLPAGFHTRPPVSLSMVRTEQQGRAAACVTRC